METAADAAEQTVVAFLDEGDGSEVANPIHADGFAREHGFRGPLVGGVNNVTLGARTVFEKLKRGR